MSPSAFCIFNMHQNFRKTVNLGYTNVSNTLGCKHFHAPPNTLNFCRYSKTLSSLAFTLSMEKAPLVGNKAHVQIGVS